MVALVTAMREDDEQVALGIVDTYLAEAPTGERDEYAAKLVMVMAAYFAHVIDNSKEAAAIFNRIALHAARSSG